jgi:5-methyltetrahydropteroyltriglutamate--homocysteine methyltransferase
MWMSTFGELAVDGFFLEYDDARSDGFEPLRFVPRGKKRVVLGLVTSKRAALESKDELKRWIDDAAKTCPSSNSVSARNAASPRPSTATR